MKSHLWGRPQVVWWALALAYGALQWARRRGDLPLMIDWYFADVLCLPLVLGLVLAAQRLVGRPADWTLPWWHGLAGAIFYAVYFEGVLPRLSDRAVADPTDALAYLLGWGVFESLINQPGRKIASSGIHQIPKKPRPEGHGLPVQSA